MQVYDVLGRDKYAYLYAARGADRVSVEHTAICLNTYLGGRACRLISINDASYVKKITDAGIVIFPEGSAENMQVALQDEGRQNLRKIVLQNKAAYVGFGEGSFLANNVKYTLGSRTLDLNFDLSLCTDYPLRAPAYTLSKNPDASTCKAVPVTHNGHTLHVFWNGGGVHDYPSQYDSTIPIATYDEVNMGTGVAAMRVSYHPNIVYCHVHPQMRLTRAEIDSMNPQMPNKEAYLASAPKQEALFDDIFNNAGLIKTPVNVS